MRPFKNFYTVTDPPELFDCALSSNKPAFNAFQSLTPSEQKALRSQTAGMDYAGIRSYIDHLTSGEVVEPIYAPHKRR